LIHDPPGSKTAAMRKTLKALGDSRGFLRVLLAIPAALMLYFYAADAATYGETIHASGDWSVRLLMLTMAITPARMLFPGAGPVLWLTQRRRDFGVASFGYALLHTLVYLQRKADFSLILSEGTEMDLSTGWLAFVVFALLAITSNDASVRLLRRWWKRLHRLVYAGAVLALAHWLLTAFDIVPGLIHAGILAGIEGIRVVLTMRGTQPVESRVKPPPLTSKSRNF
jgi:sulfoxide reductase heme-binding subunit YedZ